MRDPIEDRGGLGGEPDRLADFARGAGAEALFRLGRHRCRRCGLASAQPQDFVSGLVLDGGRCVRLHPPRWTLVCMHPGCRHSAVVERTVDPAVDGPPVDPATGRARSPIPDAVAALLRPGVPNFAGSPPVAARGRRVDGGALDLAAAWRRVGLVVVLLLNALADLEEAGGLGEPAAALGWTPQRWAEHLEMVRLLCLILQEALRQGR